MNDDVVPGALAALEDEPVTSPSHEEGMIRRSWRRLCVAVHRRRRPIAVFLVVFGCASLLSGGHSYSVDEETYLANLRALLHGQRELEHLPQPGPDYLLVLDKDGGLTSFYGIGTAIFTLPAFLIGKLVSFGVPAEWRELTLRLFYFGNNAVALAITAAVLVLIGRQLGLRDRTSTMVALCHATGTLALAHAKTGFSETLAAMFLTIAVLQLLRVCDGRHVARHALGVGLALGAMCMMRASAAVFVPLFAVVVWWWAASGRRLRSLLWLAGGLALPIGVIALNNWWRFGSPFDTGYPSLTYDTPLYEGVFGLLFSSGKGLVWYAPIAICAAAFTRAAWRASRAMTLLAWACIGANVMVFARFRMWSGDNAFGPRYMVIVLPLFAVLLLLAARAARVERGVAAAWVGGAVSSIGGSLVYFNAVYAANVPALRVFTTTEGTPADSPLDWAKVYNAVNFTPRFSQLAMHTRSLPRVWEHTRGLRWNMEGFNPFVDGVQYQLSWYQSAERLDTWWAYWLEFNAPKWILIFMVIQVAVLVLGVRLMRRTGSSPTPVEGQPV